MSEDRDPHPIVGATFGVMDDGGQGPRFLPWAYAVSVVGIALLAGLAGPFNGWWALLAALVAAAITYVAVAVVSMVIVTIDAVAWSWWCRRRFRKAGRDVEWRSHGGLQRALPLRVDEVQCSPDRFVIRGDRGHMTFSFQPWRVTDHNGVRFGWSSSDVSTTAQTLRGRRIVDFTTDALRVTSLIFDNGWRLELFHDVNHKTRLQWSFRHDSRVGPWLRRRFAFAASKRRIGPTYQPPT